MKKRCTLKDIAQITGLTVNSVSHALRNKSDISEDTKEKVRAAAAELGYVPNNSAASLRNGKTNVIGIIYDNILNPYYSIMIHYINESLSKYNYGFLTLVEKDCRKITSNSVKSFAAHNVDGIISFLEPYEDAAEFLKQNGIPMIVIGRHIYSNDVDYIYTDDELGGYIAAKNLLSKGYRDIVYMTDTLEISCAKERVEGYQKALDEYGLKDSVYMMHGESYSDALKNCLDTRRCDALICFNDLMALEILYTLVEIGRNDIPIIGYDNIQRELKIPNQLTTVGFDKSLIAETAVNALMNKITGETAFDTLFAKKFNVGLVEGVTAPTKI